MFLVKVLFNFKYFIKSRIKNITALNEVKERSKSVEINPYDVLNLNEYLDTQLVCMLMSTVMQRLLNGVWNFHKRVGEGCFPKREYFSREG